MHLAKNPESQTRPATTAEQAGVLALLAILALAIIDRIVPLVPSLPSVGLDPSWSLGMAEALERNWVIGEDIVFTFGPAASAYTQTYVPGFHWLTLLATGTIALALVCGLLLVSRGRWLVLATALVPFVVMVVSRDALCLYVGLLFAYGCAQSLPEAEPATRRRDLLLIVPMALALGVLGAVKGSFLVGSVAFLAVGVAALVIQRRPIGAVIAVLAALAGFLAIWMLFDQPLDAIPAFLRTMVATVSSYSEAMSIDGEPDDPPVFLIAGGLALLATFVWPSWPVRSFVTWAGVNRLLGTAALGLFLFLCWKAGFVRHDSHAFAAVSGLALAAVPVAARLPDAGPWGRWAGAATIAALIVGAFVIHAGYASDFASIARQNVERMFARPVAVLASIGSDEPGLAARHQAAIDAIARSEPIPTYDGTVDIYSYDQAQLIASENDWKPRPVPT